MKIEDRIKQVLGEAQFQVLVLMQNLEEANDKIKALEARLDTPKEFQSP